MRELRVSRSSSDRTEGSGVREAADVNLRVNESDSVHPHRSRPSLLLLPPEPLALRRSDRQAGREDNPRVKKVKCSFNIS